MLFLFKKFENLPIVFGNEKVILTIFYKPKKTDSNRKYKDFLFFESNRWDLSHKTESNN